MPDSGLSFMIPFFNWITTQSSAVETVFPRVKYMVDTGHITNSRLPVVSVLNSVSTKYFTLKKTVLTGLPTAAYLLKPLIMPRQSASTRQPGNRGTLILTRRRPNLYGPD